MSNSKYSISPLNQTNKYIGRTDGTSLGLVTCADPDSIPDECLWTLSGNKIRCTVGGTTYYLKAIGAIVYLTSDSSAIGIDWYRAKTDYYGNTSSYPKRELQSGFSIDNITLDVDGSGIPVINPNPTNTLWAESGDFTYTKQTVSGLCGNVSISGSSITGTSTGPVKIVATHKLTGLTCEFYADVRAELEFDEDYTLPSDIKEQLFTIRSLIWQTEHSSATQTEKNYIIQSLELEEDLLRADYILTGNNYCSSYANALIPNFESELADGFSDPYLDNLYIVVANRLLVLYGLINSETEINNNAYFLDVDCDYSVWSAESTAAYYWFLLAEGANNNDPFLNKTGSSVSPALRTASAILNIHIYRRRHDEVKLFVAATRGAATEVSIINASNAYVGRADIVQDMGTYSYVWEVKPDRPVYYDTNGKGTIQLNNYISNGNNGTVTKGTFSFHKPLTTGLVINSFYLRIAGICGPECLKVSPSPNAYLNPDENGLILYDPVDEGQRDPSLATYESTETQVELFNEYVRYASPAFLQIGEAAKYVSYTKEFVTGMLLGIGASVCISFAPALKSVIEPLLGTTATATQTIITAIENGQIKVAPMGAGM